MKLAIAIGFAALLGVGYFFVEQNRPKSAAAIHAEWKRNFIEPVTAVRPERFEAMKWHPTDAKPVEMRSPASK